MGELHFKGALKRKHHPSLSTSGCLYSSSFTLDLQECTHHAGSGGREATPCQFALLLPSKAAAHLRKIRPSAVTEAASTPTIQSQVLPSNQTGICFLFIPVHREAWNKDGLWSEASSGT